MSSFKIYNTNVDENTKINDVNTKLGQLFAQNASGRQVIVLDGVGGASLYGQPNGTVVYSLNQSPGQIVVDADDSVDTPAVGTEYIVYAGANNTVYLENQKPSGRIQISGTATNTGNVNVILAINSKCTLLKLTQTLWIVQGDGLTYAS